MYGGLTKRDCKLATSFQVGCTSKQRHDFCWGLLGVWKGTSCEMMMMMMMPAVEVAIAHHEKAGGQVQTIRWEKKEPPAKQRATNNKQVKPHRIWKI